MLPHLIGLLVRLLGRLVRLEVEDRCGILGRELPPVIWAFWHNRIFMAAATHGRKTAHRRGVVLTSPSKDGELLARIMKTFRVDAVRGSSSRRGGIALRELATALKAGADLVLTPDGPRGPRYRLAPGILLLAQATGAPIMPVHVAYSRYWSLKSWDRFRIPKPFSRVRITFGPLETVAQTETDEAFEAERARIEAVLCNPPER